MPYIDFSNVEETDMTSGGSFKKLPAGGYVAKIVDTEYIAERKRLWLVIDIAEGEYASYYADAWGIGHPGTHRLMVSYLDSAKGMLLWRLNRLTEWNPGFDAIAASNGDNWEAFIGKKIGLVVGEEEYESNTGEVRTRLDWFHAKWMDPAQIRTRDFKVPDLKKLKAGDAPRNSARSAYAYDDEPLPFS